MAPRRPPWPAVFICIRICIRACSHASHRCGMATSWPRRMRRSPGDRLWRRIPSGWTTTPAWSCMTTRCSRARANHVGSRKNPERASLDMKISSLLLQVHAYIHTLPTYLHTYIHTYIYLHTHLKFTITRIH